MINFYKNNKGNMLFHRILTITVSVRKYFCFYYLTDRETSTDNFHIFHVPNPI